MRRAAFIIVAIELLVLIAFFFSARAADSVLSERGGSGDAALLNLWNTRAAFAFIALVALWLLSLGQVVFESIRGQLSFVGVALTAPRGMSALAVGLPVIGFAVGYAILLALK